MKLVNRYNSIDQNLIVNNISDWRLLIQHPNTVKTNNSEDLDVINDGPRTPTNGIQNGDQLIPMYCTILGLIIICLIGYVIYKLWKQKNSSLPCTAIVSKGSSGNSFRLPKYSPNNKPTKEMTALVNSNDGVKWPNFEHFMMTQPLYCLPEEQIEAIIFSLSDESSGAGWVQLAQYYNFKQEEIDTILQIDIKIDAVRAFLKKWSENPNHNLKKLIKSLHEISRPDTAFLIKSSMRKSCQKDLMNNEKSTNETNNNMNPCIDQRNDDKVINT